MLTLFICNIITYNTSAQTCKGQQEIEISYGLLSGKQVSDFFTETEDNNGIMESSHSGIYFVTYRYYVDNSFSIGLAVGNQNIQGSVNDNQNYGQPISNFNLRNTTLAPEIKWDYINRKYFRMFLLFGAGVAIYNYAGFSNPNHLYAYGIQKNGINPNFQLTPLAFSVGGRFSWSTEFGFGYKGMLNTGFSYRIGKTDFAPKRQRKKNNFKNSDNYY